MSPLEICLVLAGLGLFAFWLWALADCALNEPSDSIDKLVWVVIILGASLFGALLYAFVRRPRRPPHPSAARVDDALPRQG